MMEVKWLKEALQDLKEIGRFIAQDDPAAAYRVLSKIEAAALSLQQHPHQGRPGRVSKTRELVISGLPYILPYYLKQQEVRILAVMHTSRKWPDEFQNLLP
ncbi:MAG: type II toxin-antitoxin system RelE/ParE family toxin [Nitrospirota bacterium]|nr:type II toxin-antitoxin system RelE/ParE family toxin [Nitrospirota bacterium]